MAHPSGISAVLQCVLRRFAAVVHKERAQEVKNLKKAAAVTMVAGGLVAAGAGFASATDAHADGKAIGSPGVASGNLVQVPVAIPVNAVGNTVNVVGILNPAFGNDGFNG